jgi:hypothetical protein
MQLTIVWGIRYPIIYHQSITPFTLLKASHSTDRTRLWPCDVATIYVYGCRDIPSTPYQWPSTRHSAPYRWYLQSFYHWPDRDLWFYHSSHLSMCFAVSMWVVCLQIRLQSPMWCSTHNDTTCMDMSRWRCPISQPCYELTHITPHLIVWVHVPYSQCILAPCPHATLSTVSVLLH